MEEDLGRDIFSGLKRTFADSAWMLSLVSVHRFMGRGKKYTQDPLYSLIDVLIKFEVSPRPFEPVFTLIRESRFNSFCWAVWVGWFILVDSHSSELRIDHRLFFFIPESFRKVLENFERLSQRYGLVRKPDHSVHSD